MEAGIEARKSISISISISISMTPIAKGQYIFAQLLPYLGSYILIPTVTGHRSRYQGASVADPCFHVAQAGDVRTSSLLF